MNKLDVQAKFSEEAASLSMEQLIEKFDAINEKLSAFSAKFEGDKREKLIKLFNSGLYKLDYQHAKFFRHVFDKLKANEVVELEGIEYRNIQQIMMKCVFSNPVEAAIIDDALDATKEVNEELYELEAAAQIYAYDIERRKTELETGLQYTDEDNSNIANLDVRPQPLVEAAKGSEAVIVEETEK